MTITLDNIPTDQDTDILFEQKARYGEREAVYQRWNWDGIRGESLIFLSADVPSEDIEPLKEDIRQSALVRENSQITVKDSNGYLFYNFNFDS